jgi:hypothetical protein
VSLDGASGPQLVILSPSSDGLTPGATYTLPAQGDAVAWGNLGGGADVAVGAGGQVVMIYDALGANPQTETVSVPFQVAGLAWAISFGTATAARRSRFSRRMEPSTSCSMEPQYTALTAADIPRSPCGAARKE